LSQGIGQAEEAADGGGMDMSEAIREKR
jgi:hypothetical protein